MTNLEKLVENLSLAGKPTDVVRSREGGAILILPHGGRVLGLSPPGSSDNFFWTHPALDIPETTRAFYESGQWQNSGGDRTWLSPEIDFFFPDFPDTRRYWQPRDLDPGNYRLSHAPDGPTLTNHLTLFPSRSRRPVELEIRKTIAPAPNPLRHEGVMNQLESVAYAGYCLRTSLELHTGDETTQIGLWNLLQMPHGGEFLGPTHSGTEPRVYFGTIPQNDIVVKPNLIRYRMRAGGGQKIGIRAASATGRAGYLYHTGGHMALVIRNYTVNPSGEYVDVPSDDPREFGYSTQACNVDNQLGAFSELEYHVPAIGPGTGFARSEDVSQVWAFRGPPEEIRTIARNLLSPDI